MKPQVRLASAGTGDPGSPRGQQSHNKTHEQTSIELYQTLLETVKNIDSKVSTYNVKLAKVSASVEALEKTRKDEESANRILQLTQEPQFKEMSFDGTRPKTRLHTAKHGVVKNKKETADLDPVPAKVSNTHSDKED